MYRTQIPAPGANTGPTASRIGHVGMNIVIVSSQVKSNKKTVGARVLPRGLSSSLFGTASEEELDQEIMARMMFWSRVAVLKSQYVLE